MGGGCDDFAPQLQDNELDCASVGTNMYLNMFIIYIVSVFKCTVLTFAQHYEETSSTFVQYIA